MGTADRLQGAANRVNARAWGIALGLALGLGLFVATNVLVLKGGDDVGRHLGRLVHVMPGYTVSFVGSLVGFVYAFVVGYGLGRLIGPRRGPARHAAPGERGLHARLDARTWSLALGLVPATVLAATTAILAVRGGEHPGELLERLHVYFPGYSVSLGGAAVGFLWAAVLGALLGRLVVFLYHGALARAEA